MSFRKRLKEKSQTSESDWTDPNPANKQNNNPMKDELSKERLRLRPCQRSLEGNEKRSN